MSTDQSDHKESKRSAVMTSLPIIIPIVVSIVSLLFGAYQYVDKRVLEKEKNQLENQRLKYELREKEQNTADISVDYIETKLLNIGNRERVAQWVKDFGEQNILPFKVKLRFQETPFYKQWNPKREDYMHNHVLFFLIRNVGRSEATNINFVIINLFAPTEKEEAIRIDRLDPGTGVMVLINDYNKSTTDPDAGGDTFGTGRERRRVKRELTYFDGFLKENKEVSLRDRNESLTLLDNASGTSSSR